MSASARTSFLLRKDASRKTTEEDLVVIASAAKQSMLPQVEEWIASSLTLLAMTGKWRKTWCD
jgi:hypothetical protein